MHISKCSDLIDNCCFELRCRLPDYFGRIPLICLDPLQRLAFYKVDKFTKTETMFAKPLEVSEFCCKMQKLSKLGCLKETILNMQYVPSERST